MSYAIFIKMDGIKGESTDAKHREEIDVLSWDWGVTNVSSETVGKVGRAAGKAKSSDLNFSHRIDLASPPLIKACASGRHLKEAEITVYEAGHEPQQFLVVKLHDVMVKSVEIGVDISENSITENVALSFSRIEFLYSEQKPGGTAGSSSQVIWDIKSNKVG